MVEIIIFHDSAFVNDKKESLYDICWISWNFLLFWLQSSDQDGYDKRIRDLALTGEIKNHI